MIAGKPDAGAAQRAGDAQHPRRALGHLQGRVRPPPVARARCRPARRRSATMFRRQPDALERAAELDAQYGTNPPLDDLPMYGVVFSFKDPFDTKDMRTTGRRRCGLRHRFPGARPYPRRAAARQGRDHLRQGGLHRIQRPRRQSRRPARARTRCCPRCSAISAARWGGNPSNVYDTTRAASLGSSSGSGVSVSANLVMCSLGEETRASCRGPANHNAVALILPHKAMLGFDGGAIGADIYCDRSGILARTIADCAKVLDALKDPDSGYYDPRDPYTTVPRSSVLAGGYARHARAAPASLRGMRIGIVRELMLVRPGDKVGRADLHAPPRPRSRRCSAASSARPWSKSADPLWERDPDIETDAPRFPRGRWRSSCRCSCPICCSASGATGSRCSRNSPPRSSRPSSLPGKFFGSGDDGADRLLRRARRGPHRAAAQPRHRHDPGPGAGDELPLPHPAISVRRAADWQARGFTETLDRFRRRSTPARNSGATTAAPPSGTGRRSPTRATGSAAARGSTSASCCASCCAGST